MVCLIVDLAEVAVGGIGAASFLPDVGHEVVTALLPSFLTSVLRARPQLRA